MFPCKRIILLILLLFPLTDMVVAAEPKQGFFNTDDGVRLNYMTLGDSGSWVVMVHGFTDTAEVYVYPNCRDNRLVADVLRMDKGHTEGLEPQVTEALIRMMFAR